jgi:hypothetical protein
VDWVHVVDGRDQCQAFVSTARNVGSIEVGECIGQVSDCELLDAS